jgi:hypothetical protein
MFTRSVMFRKIRFRRRLGLTTPKTSLPANWRCSTPTGTRRAPRRFDPTLPRSPNLATKTAHLSGAMNQAVKALNIELPETGDVLFQGG